MSFYSSPPTLTSKIASLDFPFPLRHNIRELPALRTSLDSRSPVDDQCLPSQRAAGATKRRGERVSISRLQLLAQFSSLRWGCGGHVDSVMQNAVEKCICTIPTPAKPWLVSAKFEISLVLLAKSLFAVIPRRGECERSQEAVDESRAVADEMNAFKFRFWLHRILCTICGSSEIAGTDENSRVQRSRGMTRRGLMSFGSIFASNHTLMVDVTSYCRAISTDHDEETK